MKITIELNDLPDGKVKVVSTPSVEELFKSNLAGHDMTPAQGYALTALNAVQRASREPASQLNVWVPKVRGGG